MNKSAKIEQAPEQFVDPRQRMKEVRQDVRLFVEGKSNPWGISHLGDLPDTMADARRVIIALQDMLDDKIQKHNKASSHIRDLIEDNSDLEDELARQDEVFGTAMTMLTQIITNSQAGIANLQKELSESRKFQEEVIQENVTLTRVISQKNEDIAALKRTIKLSL